MGIDVHFFIEKKNESGKWEWMEGYEDILGRDSDLFTLINGVKDTGIKGRLKKEENLPVDMNDKLRNDLSLYSYVCCITLKNIIEFDWGMHWDGDLPEDAEYCQHCGRGIKEYTYRDRFSYFLSFIEEAKVTFIKDTDDISTIRFMIGFSF